MELGKVNGSVPIFFMVILTISPNLYLDLSVEIATAALSLVFD